jgi:hypothetical protein
MKRMNGGKGGGRGEKDNGYRNLMREELSNITF